MKWVSASEVIELHDRILQVLPGVPGMADSGRADAIIHRVQNRSLYEDVTDVYELAATYWVAIARGHIFVDGNKRTSFFVTMLFLDRNGIEVLDNGTTLEDLTVEAATGSVTTEYLAGQLRSLTYLGN